MAGITISSLTGSGLFEKATTAKQQHEIGYAKEKIILALYEYEAAMKKETLYSVLSKIEGLESIEPNDEISGPPYTIVVDGYKFLITAEKEIIYQGTAAEGVAPEIESVTKKVEGQDEQTVSIEFTVKTKDDSKLKEVILIKNEVEFAKIENINEKELASKFDITGNGTYQIKVVGNNGKFVTSEPIEVTELTKVSGTLQAGTVIDGSVLLTVTGEVQEANISKVEIYQGETLVKTFEYNEATKNIQEEYQTDYIPFYQENSYTAKIISTVENKTATTNRVTTKNTDTIKTETDLKKLAEVVNGGTTFENKTINQISTITLNKNHIVIGTESKPFKGTYNGQENTIKNIKISNSSNFQGLFGYVDGATLKNVILGTGSISAGNRAGGLVGYANNSIISNVQNNGTTVTGTTTYTETGTCAKFWEYGRTIDNWSHTTVSTGGIAGKIEETEIHNCINSAKITTTNSTGGMIGGIVGYAVSDNCKNINSCENRAEVTGEHWFTAGIVGLTYGNVVIDNCINSANIKSLDLATGGIVGGIVGGTVKNCKNNDNITISGNAAVGGIIGASYGGKSISDIVIVENNNNLGDIIGTSYISGTFQGEGRTWTYNQAAIGGIIGFVLNTKITLCSNEGLIYEVSDIDDNCAVGGIAGEIRNSEITKCYNLQQIGKQGVGDCNGGIVGLSSISKVSHCYNKGLIYGRASVGGISGFSAQLQIEYCYNVADIIGTMTWVGGISGVMYPFDSKVTAGNVINKCYNTGKVTGTNEVGSINGYFDYCRIDYTYALTGTHSSLWGFVGFFEQATNQGLQDKETLISTILSNFGNNFKEDTENINKGYPILSWQ